MADPDDSREKRRAYAREWARAKRAANPEEARAKQRAHIAANRSHYNAKRRGWVMANPDKAKAALKAWRTSPYGRIRNAFVKHRDGAKRRNIEFLLTFEEWWDIWQASGKWEQRGCRRGQYCMARFGDVGPYAIGNVRICTHAENIADAVANGRHRKSEATRQRISVATKSWWGRQKAHQGVT